MAYTVEYYAVTTSEGGIYSPITTLANFVEESDAEQYAKQRTWWGGDASVSRKKTLTVFTSVADAEENHSLNRRKKVLDKLSDDDLEVLGLER